MWNKLNFPEPNAGFPILLVHVTGKDERTLRMSRTNTEHNDIAIKIWKYIRGMVPEATISVLCYYSSSVKDIKEREPNAKVFSVNQYQGKEADFVIIVTTRAMPTEQADAKEFRFLLDEQRTTVALSRPKESIFLVGDLNVLCKGAIWRKFIMSQDEKSAVVDLEVLNHWLNDNLPSISEKFLHKINH